MLIYYQCQRLLDSFETNINGREAVLKMRTECIFKEPNIKD